jgi:hypothetical protein
LSLFHEKGCPQTHTKEKVAPVDPARPACPVAPADGAGVQTKQNKWKNL